MACGYVIQEEEEVDSSSKSIISIYISICIGFVIVVEIIASQLVIVFSVNTKVLLSNVFGIFGSFICLLRLELQSEKKRANKCRSL